MSTLRELKQFLGIYMLRKRSQRLLQLLQEAYIKKIANQNKIDLKGRLLDTPMVELELPTNYRLIYLTRPSPIQTYQSVLYPYQEKRLLRCYIRDQYLYSTRSRVIYYRGDKEGMNGRGRDKGIRDKGRDNGDGRSEAQSFIYASDVLFADNSVDRKSLQGYIIKLFRGLIVQRANKQGTTLSIEAELLALLQTAKEAIFISRLFKAIMLHLNEPLIINCDNTQILRLIIEDTASSDTLTSTNTSYVKNTQ